MMLIKSASEVVGYLRDGLLKTSLKDNITGNIYRNKGDRPRNSDMEDLILIHTAGLAGQTQSGTITMNLFVPNPDNGRRTMELEKALLKALSELPLTAIRWELSDVPQSMALEDVQQTFIYAKIKYKIFNTKE